MSRAFRDTFKQTFCASCQQLDRHDSDASFKQLGMKKPNPQYQMSTSMICEPVSTHKCSMEHGINTTPIENDVNENHSLTVENHHHSTLAPLLYKQALNGS